MKTKNATKRPPITGLLILCILFTAAFWAVAKNWDVYKNAVAGAFFEMGWLPVILFTVTAPLLSIYFWAKDKWRIKSAYLYTAVLSVIPVYLFLR